MPPPFLELMNTTIIYCYLITTQFQGYLVEKVILKNEVHNEGNIENEKGKKSLSIGNLVVDAKAVLRYLEATIRTLDIRGGMKLRMLRRRKEYIKKWAAKKGCKCKFNSFIW